MATLEDRVVAALEVVGADVAALQRASGGNGWAVYAVPNLKFLGQSNDDPNTLDFYEEGSFTPTLHGAVGAGTAVYSTAVGRYIRMGKYVAFSFRIGISSIHGATGQAIVRGLPFIAGASDTGMRGGCVATYWAGMVGTIAQFTGVPLNDYIPLFIDTAHVSSTTNAEISTRFTTNSIFYMHGHYFTAG